MTAELTKRARCCFWKDFIYNTRTTWQPITTHVWPKGVHRWWNRQIMKGNRREALILIKEVFCCWWWFFFRAVVFCFDLKIAFVLPTVIGTDGVSRICCYNRAIFLQCCIRVQICVQRYFVSSIMLLWFGLNVEKMSIFLVCNKDICSPSGRCSMLSQLVMWLGNKIIAERIDLMAGLKTHIRKLYFTEDRSTGFVDSGFIFSHCLFCRKAA